MISLGKFLSYKRASAVEPLRQLLVAVSRSAVRSVAGDREAFQQEFECAAERITPEIAPEAIALEVAGVIESLRRYNTAVEQRSAAQQQELRRMISAGLETVAAIGESSKTGIQQLRVLEAGLESASELEDLRVLRGKMLACLALVRNETVRMQMESRSLVRTLQASTLRASAELDSGADATTGLPGPMALQRALRSDAQAAGKRTLAIFVVKELAAINTRYGRAAGDEVLRRTSEILLEAFSAQGKIHRWNGPAFVVTANPAVDSARFEARAQSVAGAPFATSLTTQGESKSVSASLSCQLETLPAGELSEAACRSLDCFVAQHSCAKASMSGKE